MWGQISQLIFSCHTTSDMSKEKPKCLKITTWIKKKNNGGWFFFKKNRKETWLDMKPSGSNGVCQWKTNSLTTCGTALRHSQCSASCHSSCTPCLCCGWRRLLRSTLAKTRRCAKSCSSWRLAGCWTGFILWSVKWIILIFSRRLVHFCVSWGNTYLGN